MADYPSTLPIPTQSGFQLEARPSFRPVEFDVGSTVFVPLQAFPPERANVRWVLDAEQAMAWASWFEDARLTWFLMRLPDGPGGAIVSRSCHFASEPSISISDGLWTITASLEVSP